MEAGVAGTLLIGQFHSAPGILAVRQDADLLLAVDDCPQGRTAARRLGSWDVFDTGGRMWLQASSSNGVFGAVDCGSLPSLWVEPWVRGFASAGSVPITGSNPCEGTVSVRVSGLTATVVNRSVAVGWTTSAAVNHAGFHVYRSQQIEGPYERRTEELLVDESPHRWVDAHVDGDRTYYYQVGAVDGYGHEDLFGPAAVTTPMWRPLITELAAVVPTPFRGETQVRFALAAAGRAQLNVYDVGGRLVRVLQDGELPAGEHAVTWDGRSDWGLAGTGIYFVRFEALGRRQTRRLVFLGPR